MATVEDAERCIKELNGLVRPFISSCSPPATANTCPQDLNGRRIRVDYSVTDRPHAPTPGEYMGHRRREDYPPRTSHYGGGRSDYGGRDSYRDRDRDRDYGYGGSRYGRDRDRDEDYAKFLEEAGLESAFGLAHTPALVGVEQGDTHVCCTHVCCSEWDQEREWEWERDGHALDAEGEQP